MEQGEVQGTATGDKGLRECDFRRIAHRGFGDGENSYAHSMCWFQEYLYVGVSRNVMISPKPFAERVRSLISMYPVRVPETSPWDKDWRAQIWRYEIKTDGWSRVFVSPVFIGRKGFEVPRHLGLRAMTVFKGKSDSSPALYASAYASRMGPGPIIMRCADGNRFEEASDLGPALGAETARGLKVFDGRLFVALTVRNGSRDVANSEKPVNILTTEDPLGGPWETACAPSFGDRSNVTIFTIETFHGFLYAATMNPFDGFQIWKTDAAGKPPFKWYKIITSGAYRGNLNETVASMCVFDGCLYVGTAINYGGYDRVFNVGPAAPELIRIHPDDSWDLIMGSPRNTPLGLKVPLSGQGPGFNNPFTAYIWQLCEHDGWLYAGTADKASFLPYSSLVTTLEEGKNKGYARAVEKMMRAFGGFDLWRSRDGMTWIPITLNGFGNAFNMGVRTMTSSPAGLFVGTANPFGPEVAIRRSTGWHYEQNERGGLEIWVGKHKNSPGVDETKRDKELILRTKTSTIKGWETWDRCQDLVREFYGHTGFCSCGYWGEGVRDPIAACKTLIDELVSLTRNPPKFAMPIPQSDEEELRFFQYRSQQALMGAKTAEQGPPARKILDLGFDRGETAAYLSNYFVSQDITSAISQKRDREASKKLATKVQFQVTKLPRLNFRDNSFDYVLAIETAYRFGAKEKLFREILRVLKPGGMLLGTDICVENHRRRGLDFLKFLGGGDRENPDECKSLLLSIGFADVVLIDETDKCWDRFHVKAMQFFWKKVTEGEMTSEKIEAFRSHLPGGKRRVRHYILFGARKSKQRGELQ